MKIHITVCLALGSICLGTPALAQNEEADAEAGQAIAQFYESARNVLSENGATWEDLVNGIVENGSRIFSEILASFRKLQQFIAALPGYQFRLSGVSFTSTGPEVHFAVVNSS